MAQKIYVVQAGDSLSKIAKEIYGDAKRWKEIYEANKDKIKNPDIIQVGWELVIPGVESEAPPAAAKRELGQVMGQARKGLPVDPEADAESKVGGPKRV